MASYRHACSKEPPAILKNNHLVLNLYKRRGGWGWGELFAADGTFVAVIDHLGEIMARDQEIPMRLEAQSYERTETPEGEMLTLPVVSSVIPKLLEHTSFANWMNYPLNQPLMEGTVKITLLRDQPVLRLCYDLKSNVNIQASYIRGPWLKVGESSFGTEKEDAILPGVEWVCGREWSSGTDWFKDPWALKYVPHRNKVSIPVMAVSNAGISVSLSWNPETVCSRWFNGRDYFAQPVFATPNFIDRSDNQLLGLMLPDAREESEENKPCAEPTMDLHMEQRVRMEAEITLSRGSALQSVVDWVKRHGLPDPQADDAFLQSKMDEIARAYNTNLWLEGKGFGCIQDENSIGTYVPHFLRRFVEEHQGESLAQELTQKISWCDQMRKKSSEKGDNSWLRELLSIQQPDGSFLFDPDGRHYMKDDFVVTRDYAEPMGLAGDTALDICLKPALNLLEHSDDPDMGKQLQEAACRALDYCLSMKRPEGGDFWETPLHSPNLLAAGHAAVAYYLGYQKTGKEDYLKKAVYWIRCLLPFTHLWEPKGNPMHYYTKPCLCSSDWYFANWVRDHVQWEVLSVFALSAYHNIDWAKIDPEIDWHRFHRGITAAAARWMIDHTKDNWRPHNMPWTLEMYRNGKFDGCFPDTHNSVTGHYGGMAITPDAIANNIYAVLDSEKQD